MQSPIPLEEARALIAKGATGRELAERYNVSRTTVNRVVLRHNLGPWLRDPRKMPLREMPEDFRNIAHTIPADTARERWKCSNKTLKRWYDEAGIRPAAKPSWRNVPGDGFAYKVAGLNISQAAAVLGVGRAVAKRMMEEAGVKSAGPIRGVNKREESAKRARSKSAVQAWKPAVTEYERDMSLVGQARDFMQKLGPVTRCDLHGKPMKDGQFWRRGSTVLTDGELLSRARERGWAPSLI